MKKKQLFSLRKLTVGIASVSLGTVVFLSGAQAVDAQANAQDATTITQNAYNVVNNLPNISDKTKDAYIAKITAAAGNNKLTDVEGIVNSAKAEDAQVATAKKVAAEQDAKAVNQQVELAKKVAIETAKKDHAQKIANAKAEIYKLENLSNFTKARYSAKITKAATDEVEAIVNEAQAEDAHAAAAKKEITTAQKAHAKQIADAQALVNKLDKLSKDAKASYNQQIAQAATDEVAAIVQKAQAENAKQAPVNKEVKPAQKATTTPGQANKAGQTTTA
ncbi:hypothetical protein BU051_11035 [Staphylococcus simulans]|uniref:YSIRK-type signal peptide-containing protein n=1 Tax=Staphylococcus simulans TaxID=1286 RepID=UPI000D1D4CD2|nr:YSIRK-type signal peptide-containing protein [Staphylococcus simulans]PTJ83963.1 hypothetical protein BU051_11035 [Staphylococcus simulans]